MTPKELYCQFGKRKMLGLLIDPDKYSKDELIFVSRLCTENDIDAIFVGGSLISVSLDETLITIKKNCTAPVILFPGSCLQISDKADGILFLSLISGRNPEYLIGNHVVAAPLIKKSNLFVIPTGYMLIDGKSFSSVQYMSNTMPIPSDKTDIIVATAQAGEMLGLKLIYLEAGSGSLETVNYEVITEVKKHISIPLIVGGGIRNRKMLSKIFDAGADMAVIGNAVEKDKSILVDLMKEVKEINV